MSKVPEYLFHYTIGPKMPLIAASGMLAPRRFSAATSMREKAILWWSENPQWDASANKVMSFDGGQSFVRPSMRQLQEAAGVFRFRLDCRRPEALQAIGLKMVPFGRLQLVARIDPKDMADMVQRGLQFGATPTHWWGSLDPCPLTLQSSGLLSIEAREPVALGQGQDQWAPVTMEQAIASFESRGKRVAMTTTTAVPAARNV
jgi:hypothetical protein